MKISNFYNEVETILEFKAYNNKTYSFIYNKVLKTYLGIDSIGIVYYVACFNGNEKPTQDFINKQINLFLITLISAK
jgi:hypothetical protein